MNGGDGGGTLSVYFRRKENVNECLTVVPITLSAFDLFIASQSNCNRFKGARVTSIDEIMVFIL